MSQQLVWYSLACTMYGMGACGATIIFSYSVVAPVMLGILVVMLFAGIAGVVKYFPEGVSY